MIYDDGTPLFVAVPLAKATTRMLNLSTSPTLEKVQRLTYEDHEVYLFETRAPLHDDFLEYPVMSASEAREVVCDLQDNETEPGGLWERLKGLLTWE